MLDIPQVLREPLREKPEARVKPSTEQCKHHTDKSHTDTLTHRHADTPKHTADTPLHLCMGVPYSARCMMIIRSLLQRVGLLWDTIGGVDDALPHGGAEKVDSYPAGCACSRQKCC